MESGTRLRISWLLFYIATLLLIPWQIVQGRQSQYFAMPPDIPKTPFEIEINKSVVEDPEFGKKFPYENAMLEVAGKNRMPDYNARIDFVASQKTLADANGGNVPDTKDAKGDTDPMAIAKEKPSYMDKLRNEFNMAMRQMQKMFDSEGRARDSGNERIKMFTVDDNNYYYEGGLDTRKARSGKGFLIEKTGDDACLGGMCKNYRQGFCIDIKFRSGHYLISGGIYQAGERVCKVPIPCPIRAKLADLKNTMDRKELFKCIMVMLPIEQCISDPETILGISTDDEKDKIDGMKAGLFHDEGGDANTFKVDAACAFSFRVPGGTKNKEQTVYTDFKSTLKNSSTFVFSTLRSLPELCVQLYSLTPEYAPEFKIYSVHRTLNDPTNKNKMHFIELKDCLSDDNDRGSGKPSQNKIYRTIKTEATKLYLIDVGNDPTKITEDEYTIKFKPEGSFMIYFDLGKNPLYYNLFGSAYDAVCVGDWKYKIGFNHGGEVLQFLPQTEKVSKYSCGFLDFTLAPYVDMRCDSITFYYTQGNLSENLKKRLTSLQLKSGVGKWTGWTNEEPLLHYKISNIDEDVIKVIQPLKLLLEVKIRHKGQMIYSGSVITDQNCTAQAELFSPALDRSRKFVFNPNLSGRYCIMLLSCSPNYFPSLRIYTSRSENKNEYTQLKPQFNNNTPFYDLCSGEDYLAEIGIDTVKTIKVAQSEGGTSVSKSDKQRKEAFMIIFSTNVVDYFAFFKGKTYKPGPPSGTNYNTGYEITLNPRNTDSTFIKRTAQDVVNLGTYEPQIAPYFDHSVPSISFFFPSNAHEADKDVLVQPYGTLELMINVTKGNLTNGYVEEKVDKFPHAICQEIGIAELLSLTAESTDRK